MITLLDRYCLDRLLVIGLFAVILFTLAWLAPEIMFEAIQGVSNKEITVLQAVQYLIYQIPTVLLYCLPIAALFASIFFFRQISLSSELTAIQASGIAFRRLLIPVGLFGLLMSALFFVTQETAVPWASTQLRNLYVTTGFGTHDSTAGPRQVTFVERRRDDKSMKMFMVLTPDARGAQSRFIFLMYDGRDENTHLSKIVTANDGAWDTAQKVWRLRQGMTYTLGADGIYNAVDPFRELEISSSDIAHALLSYPGTNPADFSSRVLSGYIRLLRRGGQTENIRYYIIRLYQRMTLIWMPLLLALLGAPIGIERSRSKRNLGLTYAAALLLFYNIMIPVSTTLGSIGVLSTLLASVLPILLALLAGLGIIQLRRSEG